MNQTSYYRYTSCNRVESCKLLFTSPHSYLPFIAVKLLFSRVLVSGRSKSRIIIVVSTVVVVVVVVVVVAVVVVGVVVGGNLVLKI